MCIVVFSRVLPALLTYMYLLQVIIILFGIYIIIESRATDT